MKMRLLVADDDASVRGSLRRILEDADYEVLLADNGQQAVEWFAPGEIDLLILDLDMPLKDGWETFEDLTRMDPCVPVIIMTGMANQRPILLAAGVGALFEKPIEVPVLLDTIKKLLEEPREQRLRRLCADLEDTCFIGASAGLFEGRQRARAETPLRICGSSSRGQE
jgi:DNA-binding NtrC family response regulator